MRKDRMSSEYQRAVSDFVSREIVCCLSMVISETAKHAECFPDYEDDLYGAFETEPDYSEAAREYARQMPLEDFRDWYESERGGAWYEDDSISDYFDDEDEAREFCEWAQIDVDDYRREVYEHWAVSSFLADDLEERGEKIIRDFMGFNAVWCRTTTGQAIAMDSIICDCWDAMQGDE